MTTDSRAIGRNFDSADDVFNWLNNAIFGTAAINLANRAGITARLLEGPATLAELAKAGALPAPQLGRILDFLLAHELIERDAGGAYVATKRTALMAEAAGYFANTEVSTAAATKLLPGLRQGVTPFELQFGAPVFAHFHAHPDMAEAFGNFMSFMTRRIERFIFAEHRFQPFETVADIGGSMGALLLGILREYPGTRGVLFDLPEVVALARPQVEASGLGERVEIVGGSFFESVPSADLYTLKQILHDWHDDECRQILGNIRSVMNPGARLAVIDHVLSDEPRPDESISTDVAMMVWDTGRERKLADFEALFAATGFAIDRFTPNPAGHSVIEVVKA
ncbi:hypothetical protein M3P36_14725 [Altererythrobacter sp. KTW20L]|uniref:methyltransferase n=1 Tax=Altererythrobacter sp. KTW20L TaxID=2942210 RepID=UPI0020BF51DB|nr:methyltransferase [Altererythrobacter sp. KTW20L]MCL6252294.1 hypothetical protein [Altererythrobacter sp. KTW20L]